MLEHLRLAGIEKILQAIERQRWFLFKNNDRVLMDSKTALLWANLDFFHYCKSDGSFYSYSEVEMLLKEINKQSWGGFDYWKIPTSSKLWQMIEDRTFPFHKGTNWKIKECSDWCVELKDKSCCKGKLATKNLTKSNVEEENTYSDNGVAVILFCEFVFSLWRNQEYPTTPKEILHIFNTSKYVPIFNDNKINEIYNIIFVSNEIYKLVFFPELLFSKYDMSAIRKSAIKYYDSVLDLTNELLKIFQIYETANSSVIRECLNVVWNLSATYAANSNLTREENYLLAERQEFLAERLELGIDEPKRRILFVKEEAENFFARLDKINGEINPIRAIAALQSEPRADFELLVENLSKIIRDSQRRADLFIEHRELIFSIVKAHDDWSKDYELFKTSLYEKFSASCREANINDEIFSAWYGDWQKKRSIIEQMFLSLIKFGLKENISEIIKSVLDVLYNYRDAIDQFYLKGRKSIYQKFAFKAGGDLKDKCETESKLYELTKKFQFKLQEIIFSSEKAEERIFLLNWSEPLLNLPIDEIMDFVGDRELDAVSREILTGFAELKQKNFAQYLADSEVYGRAVEKRESEYNDLIYRMRTDLEKSKS